MRIILWASDPIDWWLHWCSDKLIPWHPWQVKERAVPFSTTLQMENICSKLFATRNTSSLERYSKITTITSSLIPILLLPDSLDCISYCKKMTRDKSLVEFTLSLWPMSLTLTKKLSKDMISKGLGTADRTLILIRMQPKKILTS